MKQLILIFSLLLVLFLANSCELPNSITEPRQYGITFEIVNQTNQEYENTRVIIGGFDDNNEFISVDSLSLPTIETGVQQILGGFDNLRWKPDFDKIRDIGQGRAYFKFQFNNSEALFIEYNGNTTEYTEDEFPYLFIDLIEHEEVFDGNGEIGIYINTSHDNDRNGDLIVGWSNSV